MHSHIILSVLSDDKPGVVRAIANTVSLHNASWQESHMSRLGGKFAGVIAVVVDVNRLQALASSLEQLAGQGIRVIVEEMNNDNGADLIRANFHAAAPDRNGIVLEMSQALAEEGINVLELTTECTSMPYSGDPLFSASGLVELPKGLSIDEASDALESISSALGMDFELTTYTE